MLKNIKIIYPSPEGDVVEIFTLGRAIDNALTYADSVGYKYKDIQAVLDDILCCPCTEQTDEEVGKHVTN